MAFEAILSERQAFERTPRTWRRLTLTFSVLGHALVLAFGLAHSVWQVGEMPFPAFPVTLAMAPTPPAPPPPPPKRRLEKGKKPKAANVTPKVITPPKDVPQEQPQPAADEAAENDDKTPGEDAGQDNGVIGGIAGGQEGGVPPPRPEENRGPKLISMQAGNQLLAINPNVRPYRVNVPEELTDRMGAGEKISPVVRICVTERGSVESVVVVKGSLPMIDQQVPGVLGRWRYQPYVVNGRPQPFCYVTRYSIAAR
jgi:protein TonB